MDINRILNKLWVGLSHKRFATLVLILLAAVQIIAFALPQIPASSDQSVIYNRWLAQLRPRLGDATRPLASLGLLTIRASYLMRVTLGLLALLVAANFDRMREEWPNGSWSAECVGRLALSVGGLLVVLGWAGQMLWGWQEPEIIAWPDTPIVVPERELTLSQPIGPVGVWSGGRYGLYTLLRGQRTGLEVQAADVDGEPVMLLPSVDEAPQATLRLAFTTQEPEAFFAAQTVGLVFRMVQFSDAIQVQIYRSASGELLVETQLEPDEPLVTLQLDEVEVSITRTLLPRYEIVYNPGALPEGLGMVALVVGVVACAGPRCSQREIEDQGPDSTEEVDEE
ncbi:MAG: hypothetical protein ACP5HG_15115 [Anaerolineae bacterium]